MIKFLLYHASQITLTGTNRITPLSLVSLYSVLGLSQPGTKVFWLVDSGYVPALTETTFVDPKGSVFNFTDLLFSCWAQELTDLRPDLNT